jgi:DedD protein
VKERLTGAIILVVLIVLLVPELLSGPKGPARTGPTATAPPSGTASTSSEEPPLRSYTINLGDDAHARTEAAGSNGPAMPQPTTPPEQPAASPSTAQSVAGTSSTSPEQQTTPGPSTERRDGPQASGAQPGASSHASGAQAHNTPSDTPTQHPASRTANSSAPVAPSTATSAAATQKPAPRADASKPTRTAAADRPAPAAANTAAASESGGWAVQLGVFQSKENAERLALDVRVKGFKVSVSPITSGGRKLYRVRVGPTPDRSAAQELHGRLKAIGRPGGAVVPYS